MTIGRDLSWLFPQELKCIIYLYIINYARTKPIETLLAVNTFEKDTSDFNGDALTRPLTVRTMGCLGVEQII